MRRGCARHGTHIIHAFSLARTNSDAVRNGTRLTAATVSASRRRGPDSPAARISIWTERETDDPGGEGGRQRERSSWRRVSYLYWRNAAVVFYVQPAQEYRLSENRCTRETEAH
jgi:hypothetical protein